MNPIEDQAKSLTFIVIIIVFNGRWAKEDIVAPYPDSHILFAIQFIHYNNRVFYTLYNFEFYEEKLIIHSQRSQKLIR